MPTRLRVDNPDNLPVTPTTTFRVRVGLDGADFRMSARALRESFDLDVIGAVLPRLGGFAWTPGKRPTRAPWD